MSFRDPVPVTIPDSNSDPVSFALNSKIMLTAIIVVLFVVILFASFHLYSRWSLLRSRPSHRSRLFSAAIIFFADPSPSSVVTTRGGLDPSVIKSLPTFTFSAATAQNAIECSVCLSEFEQSESGRVLPNCKHTFHVDCIDMWFHSHSSCPLCRSLVEPLAGEVKSMAEEAAISISDPVSDDNQGSRHELCDTVCLGGSSDDSPPGYIRRKPSTIEVPRRENDLTRCHSFTSPMSRVISFKRILNRERRSASSSSIGYPPVLSPPTEVDIELGRQRDSLT